MATAPAVEGSIAAPPAVARTSLQTLDEPVGTTILRDLKRVAVKLRYVVLPGSSQEDTQRELQNWDLWGPLILCLVLSM
jgi:protein YIPF6